MASVTIKVMMERLKQALSQRPKRQITDRSQIPAAVLIPIYYKDGQYHILFIQRTDRVKVHKGQISFPGGACEPNDGTAVNTALRECTEEVGVAAEAVELLGELDDFYTIGTGYVVSPVVGLVPWPYPFKVDGHETEELIEVPISALLDKGCVRQEKDIVAGEEIPTYFYHYQGKVIWGATARILNQLLGIWDKVMKEGRETA
jgi:8-oxo-dGTP pyrophosphatase MutT (NUDIX family)